MADDGLSPALIRVDGGMVGNNWFLQFLADMLALPVERPLNVESTALGAAFLAGLQSGVYQSQDEIAALWQSDRQFEPAMDPALRDRLYRGWQQAVDRVRSSH
jgi:glycerol kinase